MFYISSSIFFGGVIIFLGLMIILKTVPGFKRLKIGSIIGGGVLIILGVSVLFGKPLVRFSNGREYKGSSSIRSQGDTAIVDHVFSSNKVDLTDVDKEKYKISSVFSSTIVYLSRDVEYHIDSEAVFGSVTLPGGAEVSFGESDSVLSADSDDGRVVRIDAEAVFGSIVFKYR